MALEVTRHDLTAPRLEDYGWFFVGMLGGCLVGGLIIAGLRQITPGATFADGGMPGLFGLLIANLLVNRRLRRVVQDDARTSAQAALEVLGRSSARNVGGWGTPRFVQPLCARVWAEYGPALLRVRGDDRRTEPWPAPLEFPFEPCLLRGNDPALRGLLDRSNGWRERVTEAFEESRARAGWSQQTMAILYAIAALAVVGGIAFVLTDVLRSLAHGHAPRLLPDLALLGLILAVLAFLQRATQWLLVPGGIMVRHGPRWRSRWQVTLFTARDAQLIYAQPAELLIVCDGRGSAFARKVKAVEAEAALRAWLSPCAPPARERLSEWGEVEAASAGGYGD